MGQDQTFKSKMAALAESNSANREQILKVQEAHLQELKERVETNKKKFVSMRSSEIVPLVRDLNEVFKKSEDVFQLFSEDQATALQDKIRTFCQVFYFRKGNKNFGFNSPSLLFECLPQSGIVKVSQHTEFGKAAPLKEISIVKLDDFNKAAIEVLISSFVEKATLVG
jgi:hypothetical protein